MKLPDARMYVSVGDRHAAPRAGGKRFSLLAPPVDKDSSSSSSSSSRSRSRSRGRGRSTLLGGAAESTEGASRSTPIAELEKAWGQLPVLAPIKGEDDTAPSGGASASRSRHPVYDEAPAFLGCEVSSAFSFDKGAPAAAAAAGEKNQTAAANGDALGGILDPSNNIYGSSEEEDLWQSVEQDSQGLGGDLWPTVDPESIREADELWGDLNQYCPPGIADEGQTGRGALSGLVAGIDDAQCPAAVGLDGKALVKSEHTKDQLGEKDGAVGREGVPAAEDDLGTWPAGLPVGFPPLPLDPPPHVLQLLKMEHENIPRSKASPSAGIADDDLDPPPSLRRNFVSEQPKPPGGDEGVGHIKAEVGTSAAHSQPLPSALFSEALSGGAGGKKQGESSSEQPKPPGGDEGVGHIKAEVGTAAAHSQPLPSALFSEALSGGAGGKKTEEALSRLHPLAHHPVYGVVPTLPPRCIPFAVDGVDGGGCEDTAEAKDGDSDGGQGPAKRMRLVSGGSQSDVVGDGLDWASGGGGGGGVSIKQEIGADIAGGRQGPVRRKKRSWVDLSVSTDETLGLPPLDPSPWPLPHTLEDDGLVATVAGGPEAGKGQRLPLPTRAISPDQKHLVQGRRHQSPELQLQSPKNTTKQPLPPLPQEECGPNVHRRQRQRQGGGACKEPGCARGRTYGYPGPGSAATYCTRHKRPGMANLVTRRCASELCTTAPSYGFDGKRPTFCRKHRLDGMINVVSPRCIEAGCTSCASYGSMRGGGPKYCAKHKIPGMTNIVSRKCVEAGCAKTPSFGREGDPKASYCNEHKLAGMMNVVTLKCLARPCRKAPSFGMPSDRRASYCKSHMQPGMVNIAYSRLGKTGGVVSV